MVFERRVQYKFACEIAVARNIPVAGDFKRFPGNCRPSGRPVLCLPFEPMVVLRWKCPRLRRCPMAAADGAPHLLRLAVTSIKSVSSVPLLKKNMALDAASNLYILKIRRARAHKSLPRMHGK